MSATTTWQGQDEAFAPTLDEDQLRSLGDGLTEESGPDEGHQQARSERDGGLALIDELLRDRGRLLRRIEEGGEGLRELARAMLICTLVSAAAFGVSVGLFRGGVQVAFAAAKFPLAMLLTTVLVAPCYSALKVSVQRRAEVAADFALILSALALTSLLMAATVPLVLLGVFLFDLGYHTMTLLAVACCGMAMLAGASLFIRGMLRQLERGRLVVGGCLLIILGLVASQVSWTLRPWLVRPRAEEVPFVRAIEGDPLDAVTTSVNSARGVYSRDFAPLPSEHSHGADEVCPDCQERWEGNLPLHRREVER